MDQDLQNRLRRLGVTRGVRDLKNRQRIQSQTHSRQQSDAIVGDAGRVISLEQLFPGGRHEQAADGACFIVDRVYPMTYSMVVIVWSRCWNIRQRMRHYFVKMSG